jgi:hypothetical protein
MAVDNGDASFSGFYRGLINNFALIGKLVDNPLDNPIRPLKSQREFGELLPF